MISLEEKKYINKESIRQSASEWVVRMDNAQLTDSEMQMLAAWLTENEEHAAAFNELALFWGLVDELAVLSKLVPLEETDFSQEKSDADSLRLTRRMFSWRMLATAASVCLLILFGSLFSSSVFRSYIGNGDNSVYITAVGEQRWVSLNDGSNVLLNTNSKIELHFTREERSIRLQRGEAHFDVASDPLRPFVVHVGDGTVTAVGTAFNVHVNQRVVDVVVTEGMVEVRSTTLLEEVTPIQTPVTAPEGVATRISVSAGESVRFDEIIRSVEQVKQEEINQRLAWQKGMLIFSGDRLEEVVDQITRYTEARIVINDSEIRGMAVGGYFRIGDTEKMLNVLESSFDIQVTRMSDKLVVLSKKTQGVKH